MKVKTLFPLFLIILGMLLMFSIPAHQPQGQTVTPNSLEFVGKVLPNGDVGVLYYTSPTGTTIIHSGTTVPVDSVCLEIYSPHFGNLSIQGEQFSKYIQENQTIVISKNQTYTSKITVPYNPQKFNASMATQTRSFQEELISIPQSNSQQYITLTIDNTTFLFMHKTSPDLIPVIFSSLGNLGIALGYTLMGVVVFFLGSISASLLLRRMKHWPEFGKMGWFLILMFLLIAMGSLIFSAYYQLAYLSWYDWLIPFYVFATLAMLELWPQDWLKLFLLIVGGSQEDKEKDWDVAFPKIARNKSDGSWEYLRPGRIEAIKRLYRHVSISFGGSMSKPEGVPIKPNEENISNLYFLKDFPDLKRDPPIARKHFSAKKGKLSQYELPMSSHTQKDLAQFVQELKTVSEFADENERLRKENRNYKIMLENGKVKYNNDEINDITEMLFEKKFEYHKGKGTEEKKEKKEKEETKDDRKE